MNRTILWFLLLLIIVISVADAENEENNKNRTDINRKEFDFILSALIKKRAKILDKLSEKFEKIAKTVDPMELKKCYNSEYGARKLNLFETSLKDIIIHYFTTGDHHDLIKNRAMIRERLFSFINNLSDLMRMIKKCLNTTNVAEKMVLGLTSLSHLNKEQYDSMLNFQLSNQMTNLSSLSKTKMKECPDPGNESTIKIPDKFDWNEKGKVTPVKHQSNCGSCFIFSAVAVVESGYLIHGDSNFKANEVDISEQAILNCLKYSSCRTGGWPTQAWKVMLKKGVVDEQSSPYLGHRKSISCRNYRKSKLNIKVIKWCNKWNNDEAFIQRFILKNGPVFGSVDANSDEWRFVKDVYRGHCDQQHLSHAITITGWTKDYWIIKNSWGTNWGKNGYLYLPRGENKCGINKVIGYAYTANK